MAEQRGFVFSVIFIVIFSVLVATIPIGLQGQGAEPDMLSPINPSLVSGFSDSEDFIRSNFTGSTYEYELNSKTWLWITDDASFEMYEKILVAGFLWLGGLEACKFVSDEGTDRGTTLTLAEIDTDDTNGTALYSIYYNANQAKAGDLICYWNTTLYASSTDAWLADGLYMLHGIGIDTTAVADVGSLLISLLFLQLPDVPLLLNILLATPIWASIIYLLWWLFKETVPFL